MEIIEKRANTIANIIRENAKTDYEKALIFSEQIDDELLNREITLPQKLQIIKRVTELIETQEPFTKEERFEKIWERKNWFSIRVINLDTGKSVIAWNKDELESYCKMYGVKTEEFIQWKLEINSVN